MKEIKFTVILHYALFSMVSILILAVSNSLYERLLLLQIYLGVMALSWFILLNRRLGEK